MSWFSQQWNKFAGTDEDETTAQPISRVEVIWGRDRLNVNLPRSSTPNTLYDLKQYISQKSGIPYDQIKLIYQGLILKDEKASLASYGLKNGSRLMLVGTQGGAHGDMPGAKSSMYGGGGEAGGSKKLSKGEELARKKKEKEADVSETGLLTRIEETLSEVRKDIAPEVDQYEQISKARVEAANHTSRIEASDKEDVDSQQRQRSLDALGLRQRKLSELLLRQLLTLDGIQVSTDELRKKRKDAVKEVQSYLDRVDAAWQSIKAEQSAKI